MDNVEIERKFLIVPEKLPYDFWDNEYVDVVQHYIVTMEGLSVRLRDCGGFYTLGIKGATKGFTRPEFDMRLDKETYDKFMEEHVTENTPFIKKKRYDILHDVDTWEVDIYPDNLMVAEIELTSEKQKFKRPSWVGKDVSRDPKYYNAVMAAKSQIS